MLWSYHLSLVYVQPSCQKRKITLFLWIRPFTSCCRLFGSHYIPSFMNVNFLRLILLRHKSMHFRTTWSDIWHQTFATQTTQTLLAIFPSDFLQPMLIKLWSSWCFERETKMIYCKMVEYCIIDISFHIIMSVTNIIFSAFYLTQQYKYNAL